MLNIKAEIERANQEAVKRMIDSQPLWVDVRSAIDVCPGLKKNMIMHAGPPIAWDNMALLQKNAVKGAIIYEKWVKTAEEADRLVASGQVQLSPCHEHNTVGSMCGVTSPSMPVFVVRNQTFGNEGYVLIYETAERERLSCGSFGDRVIRNLNWINEVVAPVLKALVAKMGSVNLSRIMSKGLTMGDEIHSRCFACTALLISEVMPYLIELEFGRKTLAEVADYMKRTEQFFVHLGMAACKVAADAADGIAYSTVVSAMARNGVEAGIRVSGLPGEWFTGPAGPIEGLFFLNYTGNDAQHDIGDSAIMETVGLGAFAHAASPSLALTKGNVDIAIQYTKEMQEICVSNNPNYGIPLLGGKGTPIGIDVRKVLDTGIAPVINTGIAHKQRGEVIGVGNSQIPIEAFEKALVAFGKKYAN